ncbi:glycosyltransferase family 9 protein [Nanoarchaeota archaeon]
MKVQVVRFLDRYFGGLLCIILGLFPRKRDSEGKSILCVQLWGIGESILTLPAISELKKVKVLVTERNKDVFNGYFDVEVIKTDPLSVFKFILKNRNKYDIVIDFEEYLNVSSIISYFVGKRRIGFSHALRSRLYTDKVDYNDKQHCSQTFMDLMKPLGIEKEVKKLLPLKYGDRRVVDQFFDEVKIEKGDYLVGMSSGLAESAKSRMWPLDRVAKVADYLIEKKNAKIVFIGSKEEKKLHDSIISKMKGDAINTCGKFNLIQTFDLIERMSLFIGNDSGPMHIGAAMGTKTIGLFGPNLPIRFGPVGGTGIYKGELCMYSPCINVHKGEVPNCYYKGEQYQKCMKNISVDDVLRVIEKP